MENSSGLARLWPTLEVETIKTLVDELVYLIPLPNLARGYCHWY
jgi:hypothetical protein